MKLALAFLLEDTPDERNDGFGFLLETEGKALLFFRQSRSWGEEKERWENWSARSPKPWVSMSPPSTAPGRSAERSGRA